MMDIGEIMSHNIVSLTDESFDRLVSQSAVPVLVDFWAEWCGPCKMITPILEELANEYSDKILFTKLNIDQHPNTAPKFAVRGIPTLLLFKKGEVIASQVGALSKLQLKAFIDSHL